MTKRMIPLYQRLNTPKPKIEPYDPKESWKRITDVPEIPQEFNKLSKYYKGE